jgi:hypothetical protein
MIRSHLSRECVDAGAPVEIEVTPEMIAAGASAIWRALCGSILHPDVCPDDLAKEVFEAMARAYSTGYVEVARRIWTTA